MAGIDQELALRIDTKDAALLREIEVAMDVEIPYHLKNLLVHCGYNSKIALANFSQEDITEITLFARKQRSKLFRRKDFVDFFGGQSKRKFYVLPGHQKLLLGIAANLKANIKTQSSQPEFKLTK